MTSILSRSTSSAGCSTSLKLLMLMRLGRHDKVFSTVSSRPVYSADLTIHYLLIVSVYRDGGTVWNVWLHAVTARREAEHSGTICSCAYAAQRGFGESQFKPVIVFFVITSVPSGEFNISQNGTSTSSVGRGVLLSRASTLSHSSSGGMFASGLALPWAFFSSPRAHIQATQGEHEASGSMQECLPSQE